MHGSACNSLFPSERQTPAAIHARVLMGDTTTEISRAVDSIGADLLVVGVPKRGVVSRALFGTTAARLLRVSRIPVLAVPEVGIASAQNGECLSATGGLRPGLQSSTIHQPRHK